MALIHKLKRKYGATAEEILRFREDAFNRLGELVGLRNNPAIAFVAVKHGARQAQPVNRPKGKLRLGARRDQLEALPSDEPAIHVEHCRAGQDQFTHVVGNPRHQERIAVGQRDSLRHDFGNPVGTGIGVVHCRDDGDDVAHADTPVGAAVSLERGHVLSPRARTLSTLWT